MNRHTTICTIAAGVLVMAVGVLLTGDPANAAGAPSSNAKSAIATAPAPFAKVYLALRGCTSCAHCRTTIRQMAKGGAKGGEARVNGDQVEVSYTKPRELPLRDVIKTLAENRLHDLNLVDVLFEANGSFRRGPDGVLRFTLAETGQAFPVAVTAPVERPPDGRRVRLVAVVDGWRGKGGLTLVAREVRPAV